MADGYLSIFNRRRQLFVLFVTTSVWYTPFIYNRAVKNWHVLNENNTTDSMVSNVLVHRDPRNPVSKVQA